jgi:hypothetical protein
VAANPPLDLQLTPLGRDGRALSTWLTTFHLASVILDPYTNESSWILPTAARILQGFAGAAVRANILITCSGDEAREFLGPLADEFLVFVDPDRTAVKALGIETLPAFVFVQGDGTVPAAAEGWDPDTWRAVADTIAHVTSWTRPTIPAPGDPMAYRGTPALA